ncbi:Aspartate racemase [Halanaerobium saccharolyticum subsp. saccharolyticum DSM 6643]|uniref:Aspartate racemase n=1 Tax=Halanaerobium saccharolyticum subsp. saccharolyticum DSM 6643 TaxID=1293054 RepID=M5E510_9FIRM|nr:aspartate/glutamate racemase family protein [Halanaerobium saccharolyticum]CCU81192.1 Aspartate racemase [Halanaerobium saccharolyticum subsp. saccharolyticum DSM 6643]
MKTIGLIGGMSWESTADYYKILNREVKARLGEPHSAKIIMHSVDFAEIEKLQSAGDWDKLTKKMINIAQKIESAKADIILICANTMHQMAAEVQANIKIPLLHIADTAAEKIEAESLKKVGLLGTKYVMEGSFYKNKIEDNYDIEVIIPDSKNREDVHRIIYQELVSGIFKNESRLRFIEIIESLKEKGAEGIILGCTEIPLLIKAKDSSLPIFNTTELHAKKAVQFALD